MSTPLGRVVHLAVFGPLGVALAIKDALPGCVERGATTFAEQYQTAKAVGEMASDYGQKVVTKKLVGFGILPGPPPPPRRAPGPPAAPFGEAVDGERADIAGPSTLSMEASPNGRSDARTVPSTDPAELSIPGYNSLSASQVVSRLAGLAPAELEAVRIYEAASRGRRTILTKIAQLQAERS